MKFFALFFLVATGLCGYFWATDGPGSGMGYATGAFAALGASTQVYTKLKTGSWLSDSAAGK